ALRPASVGWTATHFPNVGRRSTRPRASRASTIRAAADWVRPTRLPSSVTLMPGSAPSTTSAAAPLPLTPTAPAAPARARSVTASAVAPSRFAVLLVSCMTHAYPAQTRAMRQTGGREAPGHAARRADAGQTDRRHPRRPDVRAEVGRLPLDHLPRRRRGG